MKCRVCKDTGMTGWEKPMRGFDGSIHMVFVPQICMCEAGARLQRWQITTWPDVVRNAVQERNEAQEELEREKQVTLSGWAAILNARSIEELDKYQSLIDLRRKYLSEV